jgi:hypothetical protein
MRVPGVAQLIQQVLVNFIYFDILYTEMWSPKLFKIMKLKVDTEDEPLNIYFSENGYSSSLSVKSLGSTLFFLVFFL